MSDISVGLYVPTMQTVRPREVIDVSGGLVTYSPQTSCALRLTASVPAFEAWVKLTNAKLVF